MPVTWVNLINSRWGTNMAASPEQARKMSLAQDEAERNARYAQADGSMKNDNGPYYVSPAIQAAGRRVDAATAKEHADVDDDNASINDNRY